MQAHWKAGLAVILFIAPVLGADSAAVDLARLSRTIVKEPHYQGTPHYSLLVIGPKAEHRSWLVMDGDDVLYFDRNGNGDLTDAEDRIEYDAEATNRIYYVSSGAHTGLKLFQIVNVAGVKMRFEFWIRNKQYAPTEQTSEIIRAYDKLRQENSWENGTLWRLADNDSEAQNPVVMTATPAEAQITHFGGPLVFALKWGDRQKLEPWPKQTTFDVHIGTRTLPPKNYKQEIFAPLTEWEAPRNLHPTALFTFPPKVAGGQPVELAVDLDRRCCGDTLYARMNLPREAGEGRATVVLSYPAWKDRAVQPTGLTVPIGGAPSPTETAQSFVMFRWNPRFGLEGALGALRQEGLNFRKHAAEDESEYLMLQLQGKPAIGIVLNAKPIALETAKALGEGTSFSLSACDARYEVSILRTSFLAEEREAVTKTLKTLARYAGGTVYTTWDKQLSAAGRD